jgi:hypothetical protein
MTIAERKEMFGDGPYSYLMGEFYSDAQRLLGMSADQAERGARSFGADLGRLDPEQKVTIGKASKDGRLSLKTIGSFKKVISTPAITLMKACLLLQEIIGTVRNPGYGIKSVAVELTEPMTDWVNRTATIEKKLGQKPAEPAKA